MNIQLFWDELKNRKLPSLPKMMGFALLLWLVVVLARAALTEGDQIIFQGEQYYACAEGWYDEDGNSCNLEKVVFTKEDTNKEKIFHYRVPEEVELNRGVAMCFFSRGMDFRVYSTELEDSPYCEAVENGTETIYQYRQNAANLSGTDIGLTVHVVPIRPEDKWRELSIAVTPTEYSAFILQMRMEDAKEFVAGAIRSRIPRFIGSIFILFFGFAIIVYALFAVRGNLETKMPLYAWGTFSMANGAILIIETQTIQILTGHPEFWNALKYAIVLIQSYLMALQGDSITRAPHPHYSKGVGYIVSVLILIESIGALFNVLSFYRLWYISVLLMCFNAVMTGICLYREVQYSKKHKEVKLSIFMLSMMLFLFGVMVIDLGIYGMAARHMTEWGRLIRVCYILFIIVMLIKLIRLSMRRSRQVMLVKKYKEKSITDALTGLLNRGAYIEKEEELTRKIQTARAKGEDMPAFAIMSLDLNYLKRVNDTMGHDKGDRFIQNAARILKESVGDHGDTYRIGGDEFLAVLYGEDPEAAYQSVVAELNHRLEAFNVAENPAVPLCFAYGHAVYSPERNESIHDLERTADREMYECKHRMKAERTDQ